MFDAISYRKGASVIRMLYEILGAPVFQRGLQLYMAAHKYGNTETVDLWSALSTASGRPVGDLMSSWTLQMGYPMLRVVASRAVPGAVEIDVEQKWFLADGSEGDDRLWTVPIRANSSAPPASASSDAPFFSEKAFTVRVPVHAWGPSDWITLNSGHTVPLRVCYSPDLLSRLQEAVRYENFLLSFLYFSLKFMTSSHT